MNEYNFMKDIHCFSEWKEIKKIEKGWSSDEKYYIECKNGSKLLLRISDVENYEKKEKEFIGIKNVYNLGINVSEPIDFGKCGDNQYIFLLFSWIDGNDAEDVIHKLPPKEQYEHGINAGEILKKIHSIPAPECQEDWEKRMGKKIEKHLKKYEESEYRVKNDKYAIEHIRKNLHLLKNRTQNYQHGDFHIGNMIITQENELGIIDFNRWDFGDSYEEFYKMILFSREVSIPFTLGQINGYFGYKIPDDFFDILSLYVADVILYSIVWAIPFGIDEINGMIKRAEMILEDYNNFETTIPKWFTESARIIDK